MTERRSAFLHLVLALGAATLGLWLATASGAPPAWAEAGDRGRTTYVEAKCDTCHAVASAGIEARSEKLRGPDLGGFTTDDVAALARYLRREEERGEGKHKKGFKGTDEELQAIVDWLAAQTPATAAGAR